MSEQSSIDILLSTIDLAQEMICWPRGDLLERRHRCERLEAELEVAISVESSLVRFLDNGGPLLLTAIDRALYARANGDDKRAERWDSIIGHLMPLTRSDAGEALELTREMLRERPTR